MFSGIVKINTSAMTLQNNRRHMVAVTQFILITLVYVISFIPTLLRLNGILNNRLFAYFYFINHVSNFFIYLAVNKEFRKEAKNLVKLAMKREQPKPSSAFSLQP